MDKQAPLDLYRAHVSALDKGYAVALSAAGFDGVVIHSGTPTKRTNVDDQYWPLRPTPEFQHWVPLSEPHCYVIVEAGKKTRLVWPESKDFWERPAAPEATHFMSVLDVSRDAAPDLPKGKRYCFIGDDTARAGTLGIDATNPPALVAALDALRTKKTAYEIACLVEANRRAALGHDAVRRAFEAGACSELDLHLVYLKATRQDDPETPYKNIVALGASAAVLHHVAYGRDETRAESLLLDAGATYLGYGSDITRTWARSAASAGATFAGLVDAMEAMQQRLVSKVALGMPYEALHDESHRQVSAILREAGVARGSVEEIDAQGISRAFYPHGLGHSLGLQTHDVGCALLKPRKDNPFLRNTSKIEDGQVFTVEPGLYFIEGLLAPLRQTSAGKLVDWNVVDALAPFGGIRIEDDIFVSSSATRNMTREVLPKGGGSV